MAGHVACVGHHGLRVEGGKSLYVWLAHAAELPVHPVPTRTVACYLPGSACHVTTQSVARAYTARSTPSRAPRHHTSTGVLDWRVCDGHRPCAGARYRARWGVVWVAALSCLGWSGLGHAGVRHTATAPQRHRCAALPKYAHSCAFAVSVLCRLTLRGSQAPLLRRCCRAGCATSCPPSPPPTTALPTPS